MADKNSFLVYLDYQEKFQDLTDYQYRQLWEAIFTYEKSLAVPKISDVIVKAYFNIVRVDLDGHRKEYEKTCAQNKRNIQERWNKRDTEDTTVYDGKQDIPPNTDDTTVYDGTPNVRPNTDDTTVYDGTPNVRPNTEDTTVYDDKQDVRPNTEDTTVYDDKQDVRPNTDDTAEYDRIRNVRPDTNDTKRTDMIGHGDDMTCHDSERENTTTTPARDGKDVTSFSREEMEAAAIDDLTAEYAKLFNDSGGAKEIVSGLVSEFGVSLAFDCIHEVGTRASPKRPQVPSAYIREMCRNRACG